MELDLLETTRATNCLSGLHEPLGTLNCDNLPGRADNLSQINRGVSWACSNIQHSGTYRNACAVPAIKDGWAPCAMLKAKPLNLLVVGAKDVISFGAL
jgi:hypothetical protein